MAIRRNGIWPNVFPIFAAISRWSAGFPDPLFRRLTALLQQERRYGEAPAVIRRELARGSESELEIDDEARRPVLPILLFGGSLTML